jgi:hypothetical protein
MVTNISSICCLHLSPKKKIETEGLFIEGISLLGRGIKYLPYFSKLDVIVSPIEHHIYLLSFINETSAKYNPRAWQAMASNINWTPTHRGKQHIHI